MARTNYSFKKRQKELERQKKQEEKRQRRQAKKEPKREEGDVPSAEAESLDEQNAGDRQKDGFPDAP